MPLILESSAFRDGGSIPPQYTCDSNDISPPLAWHGEPDDTQSFVLIVDDPDAPGGTWDHLLLFNIPKTLSKLPENLALMDGLQYGKNSWGKSSYGGPCPPDGEHRYFFKLYALDAKLNLPADPIKSQIESAMNNHILATATIMGRYKRMKA